MLNKTKNLNSIWSIICYKTVQRSSPTKLFSLTIITTKTTKIIIINNYSEF
jgi:hypothetical protein